MCLRHILAPHEKPKQWGLTISFSAQTTYINTRSPHGALQVPQFKVFYNAFQSHLPKTYTDKFI